MSNPHEEQRHKGCIACVHYECVSESEMGYVTYSADLCNERPQLENLKGFPFKTAPSKCFQLDFWHSEFEFEREDHNPEMSIIESTAHKQFMAKYYPQIELVASTQ